MNTMTLDLLLQGVANKIKILQTPRKNDYHSKVNSFQKELNDWLNNEANTHKWRIEEKTSARKENDSIDIYGKPKSDNTDNKDCEWIIEIDATRADQVAKKMLSRFVLWGLKKNKPITYVALLYPDTQEGRNQSKKYICYGYELIHEINKKSKVYGIILGNDVKKRDKSNSTAKNIVDENIIEVFDPSESVYCNITCGIHQETNVKDMVTCAQKAILMYIKNNQNTTYDELKKSFKNYISDKKGKSRYKNTQIVVNDKQIYTYTQFRQFANWQKFIKLCNKIGITLKELVCCYTCNGLRYFEELKKYETQ